ncbi:serotriflin-like [Hemicordylus capensis]|uniref:serotriflin-like n=1 Tax=Hemicordylus capensis TaxID=884348 RepID=UPI002302EE36|nr:serotriflin-like [Hemicordylus capensis]
MRTGHFWPQEAPGAKEYRMTPTPALPLLDEDVRGKGKINVILVGDLSENQKNEIVDEHNDIRRKVEPTASNMLKMIWSEQAYKSAKNWATKCEVRIAPPEQRTVNGSLCGGNIMQSNYISSWSDAIKLWFRRVTNFRYGLGAVDIRKDIYSYTQLIWYKSYQVGCAISYCPHKTFQYLYVCHYCPAGNLVEEAARPYKEGPPCGDCPEHCEDKLCTNPCKYKDKEKYCKMKMQLFKCKSNWMDRECQATCRCKTEIK